MNTAYLCWKIGGLLVRIQPSGQSLEPIWLSVFSDYVVAPGEVTQAVQIELIVDTVSPEEDPVDRDATSLPIGVAKQVSQTTFAYRHVDLVGELTNTPRGCQGRFRVRRTVDAISRLLVLALAQAGPRLGRLLLHASAVVSAGKGVVFAGDSGAGKTTIATELQGPGEPLSVDRTLLERDASGRWLACATPFSDTGRTGRPGAGVPVAALLFIEQASSHELRRLEPADGVRAILKNTTCLARASDGDMLVLDVAGQVAEAVTCGVLRFSRDDGFWDLISELPVQTESMR